MPEPLVHRLGACTLEIWPRQRHCRTVFAAGAAVPASPQDTPDYGRTAAACGYTGADPPWALCVAHEAAHTVLAQARGLPWSPVLHSLAYGYSLPVGEMPAEEDTVLAFQRFCNGDLGALDPLECLGWTVPELARLRDQLHALTAGAA